MRHVPDILDLITTEPHLCHFGYPANHPAKSKPRAPAYRTVVGYARQRVVHEFPPSMTFEADSRLIARQVMRRDTESSGVKPSIPPPVTWLSLPHKGQLAIITSVRVVDFFQVASLQAFMFHQLQSFDRSAPDSEISFQTGVLQGVFSSAQVFTGVLWGRVADAPWGGRKFVLLIGLIGTAISCVGIAFSKSFAAAVVWRCLGGAINGTVGAARTTLAETVEKRYHSRAFLLLPLAFNIANIFGPILGGLLADPVKAYPGLFGGISWLEKYPYAAPNLLSAILLLLDAGWIFVGLRETQQGLRFSRDRGLELAESFRYWLRSGSGVMFKRLGYTQLGQCQVNGPDSPSDLDIPESMAMNTLDRNHDDPAPLSTLRKASSNPVTQSTSATIGPPTASVFTTPNVLLVLLTVAIFDFQMGGFASLWLVFLSSSRRDPGSVISPPWHFTGGLAFPPSTLGFAMAILGFLGIVLQFALYPRVNARFGLLKSTRWSLLVFPMAYFLAPYLSLMIRSVNPNAAVEDGNSNTSPGPALWFGITLVLLLQVGARTFAMPGTILLINNSAPHPSMLGTVHGLGASTSSAFRTIGPIVTGYWYGIGLRHDMVGYAWWWLSAVSLLGCASSFWAKDGTTDS